MSGPARRTFAREASLALVGETAANAPGAAVTVALCGHWEHPGPCRWPHHTAVVRHAPPDLTIRVVFACDPDDAHAVSARIAEALSAELIPGGDGSPRWTVTRQGPSPLLADEHDLGDRLCRQ